MAVLQASGLAPLRALVKNSVSTCVLVMGSTSSRKKMIYQVTPFLSLPSYHLCLSMILMPHSSYSPHTPLWRFHKGILP